jgi:hypothetical protein
MPASPSSSAGWQRSASSRPSRPRAAVIWSMTPQGAPAHRQTAGGDDVRCAVEGRAQGRRKRSAGSRPHKR